jgi:hypothetical protein
MRDQKKDAVVARSRFEGQKKSSPKSSTLAVKMLKKRARGAKHFSM